MSLDSNSVTDTGFEATVFARISLQGRGDLMNDGRLYSVQEAAAFLGGISKWTVHAWLAKGRLRRTKVGSRTMIREGDLQAFILNCNPELPAECSAASTRTPDAALRHDSRSRRDGDERR
jgi:excisionase family DNA binding protein